MSIVISIAFKGLNFNIRVSKRNSIIVISNVLDPGRIFLKKVTQDRDINIIAENNIICFLL
jgi:hypothetical protein